MAEEKAAEEGPTVDDPWKASAFGAMDKLVAMLAADPACVGRPDAGVRTTESMRVR